MNSATRQFGIPPRGPAYVPASQFGDATICDLPPITTATRRRKPRARLLTRRGQIALALVIAALIAFPIWRAWSDHARACALPVHVSANCGD